MRFENLGDWRAASTFEAAARDLARTLGRAAALSPAHRVLDAACGRGGPLEVWRDDFGVRDLTGVDRSRARLDAARARAPEARLVAGDATQVLLREPFRYDRVLCLDAAYFFPSRAGFFAAAATRLAPEGQLALVDLHLGDLDRVPPSVALAARAAGVPRANRVGPAAYRAELTRAGLRVLYEERLDAAVLDGFAAYVARGGHRAELSPGWWPKVAATARLARAARARDWLRATLTVAGP